MRPIDVDMFPDIWVSNCITGAQHFQLEHSQPLSIRASVTAHFQGPTGSWASSATRAGSPRHSAKQKGSVKQWHCCTSSQDSQGLLSDNEGHLGCFRLPWRVTDHPSALTQDPNACCSALRATTSPALRDVGFLDQTSFQKTITVLPQLWNWTGHWQNTRFWNKNLGLRKPCAKSWYGLNMGLARVAKMMPEVFVANPLFSKVFGKYPRFSKGFGCSGRMKPI